MTSWNGQRELPSWQWVGPRDMCPMWAGQAVLKQQEWTQCCDFGGCKGNLFPCREGDRTWRVAGHKELADRIYKEFEKHQPTVGEGVRKHTQRPQQEEKRGRTEGRHVDGDGRQRGSGSREPVRRR
jgi:hypothetical protein